jgi:hypothetical protein
MAQDDKAAKSKPRPTSRQPEPGPGEPPGAGAARRTAERVTGAQREHLDRVSQTASALNDALAGVYRDWVSAQYRAQAEFMRHLDQGRLQQDLEAIHKDYWKGVREATQGASDQMADSLRSYLGAIKDAVAAVDVENVDPGTLSFLAQSLNQAAALAASQQQAQQPQQPPPSA